MRVLTVIFLILISTFSYGQKTSVQKYVDTHLKQDTLFQNAVVGIYAEDHRGKCVAQWNPDLPLLTASTMKTITTGSALEILGKDFRFETRIAYTGEIVDSTLNGSLYIVGGGDPTLASKAPLAYPIEDVFAQWKKGLDELGIKEINGSIVADDRFFTDEMIPDSWTWGNIGETYGCGPSGLCFMENSQQMFLSPADEIGAPAVIDSLYPQIPNQNIKIEMTTTEADSRYRSWYYIQDITLDSELHGTLPINKENATPTFSTKHPHLGCAKEFEKYLVKNGIVCNTTIEDAKNLPTETSVPKYITSTWSPSLVDIVNETNLVSNNLYAENIFKTIGKVVTGVGSYDSARVAVNRYFASQGLSLRGYTQDDGSGLSRENYVSPRFFCNYYKLMSKNDTFALFLDSFPTPGEDRGTLKNVLKDESDEVKGRIHAKSGSLSCVRCYAGYVDTPKGVIRFAILVNNYSAKLSQMQPKIEGFMKALSLYAGGNDKKYDKK